jgi:hypothetical protein
MHSELLDSILMILGTSRKLSETVPIGAAGDGMERRGGIGVWLEYKVEEQEGKLGSCWLYIIFSWNGKWG